MAETYSTEADTYLNTTPRVAAEGAVVGGRMRRYRATITCASQASGDTIVLNEIPAGSVFAYGVLNASATMGASATIAIGTFTTADVAIDADLYRAAATFTTADVPTPFSRNIGVTDAAFTAATLVKLTIGTAALPSSGTLVVDLYYTNG